MDKMFFTFPSFNPMTPAKLPKTAFWSHKCHFLTAVEANCYQTVQNVVCYVFASFPIWVKWIDFWFWACIQSKKPEVWPFFFFRSTTCSFLFWFHFSPQWWPFTRLYLWSESFLENAEGEVLLKKVAIW